MTDVVEKVVFGEGGLIEGMSPGAMIIDFGMKAGQISNNGNEASVFSKADAGTSRGDMCTENRNVGAFAPTPGPAGSVVATICCVAMGIPQIPNAPT
jgi:hypothetical protein